MSGLAEAIDALSKEVEHARRELEGKENALSVLQDMYAKQTGGSLYRIAQGLSNQLIDLSEVHEAKNAHRHTFVDSVRDAVNRFGDQEFSVIHTEFALKKLGVINDELSKNSRSRISMALSKLVDEGVTVMSFKGGGNVPHRYRLKNAAPDQKDESL